MPRLEEGRLPIYFEPNRGQFASGVRFVGRSGAATLYVTGSETAIQITGGEVNKPKSEVIRMRIAGAGSAKVTGLAPLPGVSNYFTGNDPSRWITDVPQFGKVSVASILPGVDMVYHGTMGKLEYDFVIQPGTDPSGIHLAFDGVRSIRRDGAGDLLLETALGVIKQHRPLVYQEVDGKRIEIASSYRLNASGGVSFELARYDARRPLVIDPVLDFSATIPGNLLRANAVAVDASENTYVVGRTTTASDYPLINPLPGARSSGGSQVLLLKLNPTGTTILYSTVLGGTKDDLGYSVGADNSGNAYISGETLSSDFPVANAAQGTFAGGTRDAFIARIGAAGNTLDWSTFLGGSGGFERAYLSVDKATGDVYTAGYTDSTNFPTTLGTVQSARPRPSGTVAFAAKYTSAGVKSWATYWGAASGTSLATAVAYAPSGVHLTGSVTSVGVPVSAGARQTVNAGQTDSFVSILNLAGTAFTYSTLLGGNDDDVAASIAVDSTGKVIAGGSTLSTNFPTQSALQGTIPGFQSGFVTKINPAAAAGSQLVFSTYLGGRKADGVTAVAIEPSTDKIYAGGWTISDNFPTLSPVQGEKRGTRATIQASANSGTTWTEQDSGINSQSAYSIYVNPGAPSTLVATADISSVFRSTNGGSTWTKTHSANCGQLTLVPTGVANTLYVFGYRALCGSTWLWKSTDGGATWTSASSAGLQPIAMFASPADDKILFLLDANGSVRRTVNSGSSWTDFSTGLPASTTLYSMTGDAGSLYVGATGVVYRTALSAPSWTPLGTGIDPIDYIGVLKVNGANVFALAKGFDTSLYKLSGNTWTQIAANLGSTPKALAIAPSNPNTIYAGVGNDGLGAVYTSTDGGSTWVKQISDFEPADLQVHPTTASSVYAATSLYLRTDGFVTKYQADGSALVHSTFIGSRSGGYSNDEQVNGLATPPATTGVVYVAGDTNRLGFPITTGEQMGPETVFVAKLSDATPACTLTFSPSSAFFYPEGGTASIGIVAPSGCAWTGTPSAGWLTVAGPNSGTAIGEIDLVASANPGAQRTATIDFGGGQTISVTQAAAGCTYSLTNPATVAVGGGAVSVPLTTGAGCAWVAASQATWLSFTSPKSGSGSATLQLTASANPNAQPRVSTVKVGQASAAILQSGTCSYTLNPTSANIPGGYTEGTVTVTPSAGTCTWSASSLDNWLSITGGGAGTGNGTVLWAAAENPGGTPRTGSLQIGDRFFAVTQAACSITLSSTSIGVGGPGGFGAVALTGGGCAWTASSNDAWITITSGATGTGDGVVNFSIAANPAGTPRSGTLTVAGQTVTVNQTQATCVYSAPGSPAQLTAIGGTGSIALTGIPACPWSATSDSSWLTLTGPASGTGSATINYSYTPNNALTIRTANVYVMGIQYVLIENGVRTTANQTPIAAFRDNFSALRILRSGDSASTSLGGVIEGDPEIAQVPDKNDAWIVAKIAGGGIVVNRYQASGASGWYGLGGVFAGKPAITAAADGSAWVVGRDTGGGTWIQKVDPVAGVQPSIFLGGIVASNPSAIIGPDGILTVAYKDNFYGVWIVRYNTLTNTNLGWNFLGGIMRGHPVMTLGADNAVYIAVHDLHFGTWLTRWSQGTTTWHFVGGISDLDPYIAADSTGRVTVGVLSIYSSPAFRVFIEGSGFLPWVEPGGVLNKLSLSTVNQQTYLFGANQFRIYWYRTTDSTFGQAGFSSLAPGQIAAAPR